MKKLVSLLIALCLTASCAFAVGMPNPITEVSSTEELDNATGCFFCHPAVMGVTDEAFRVIDCGEFTMGEYVYTVAGVTYTLRAAATIDADISGVYVNGEALYGIPVDGIQIENAEGLLLARWFNLNGQYVLSADESCGMDLFTMAASEMADLTNPAPSEAELDALYASLCGEYQDIDSGRAGMNVSLSPSDGVYISVYWGNGASETYIWTMNASVAEDGLLTYSDCSNFIIGEDSVTVLYENGSGYFEIGGAYLYWTGAADEGCTTCVFELIGDTDVSETPETVIYPINWFTETSFEVPEGGTYTAEFYTDDMTETEIFLALCEEDIYDAVEITTLEPGMYVCVLGQYIAVETSEDVNGCILVNGGFDEGGATFIPAEGGTYTAMGYDDYRWFTAYDYCTAKLADEVTLSRYEELEGGTITGNYITAAIPAAQLKGVLSETTLYFDPNCTEVTFENGIVTAITVHYMP